MKLKLLCVLMLGVFLAEASKSVSEIGDPESLDGLFFIENKGQWPSQVLYKVRKGALNVSLEKEAFRFQLIDPSSLHALKHHHDESEGGEAIVVNGHNFSMAFLETPSQMQSFGTKKLDYYHNYLQGRDPSKWASHVGLYGQVNYVGLYDGVDMRMYEHEGNLKYDFMLDAGVNPGVIKIQYQHLDDIFLEDEELHLVTSVGTIIDKAPIAFQYIPGTKSRIPVEMEYVLEGRVLSYRVKGMYNPNLPLVIDPELVFGSYSGATGDNWGFTATYSSSGDAYGAGLAFGNYPTTPGAFSQQFSGGQSDISVSRFSADGTSLIYSTYLGGSDSDVPVSLVENSKGELVLWGVTGSGDFPMTVDSYDSGFSGGNFNSFANVGFLNGADGVVAVLSPDGSNLVGSTYMGGNGSDGLWELPNYVAGFNYGDNVRGEVTIDHEDNIVVISSTNSTDFPTTGTGFSELLIASGRMDAIVFKLNGQASDLLWSNYVGGSASDVGISVSVDDNNDLYICGGTFSTDFPTTAGALNETYQGSNSDGFVCHISGDGTELLSATYIGTPEVEVAYFVDIDSEGDVYVLGQVLEDVNAVSSNYPISQGVYGVPGSTLFLNKLSSALDENIFSTVLGNAGQSQVVPTAFLVDVCGRIYISGWGGQTNNTNPMINMPLTGDAFQSSTDGSDFHLMVLEPDAVGLEYGTYFGGGLSAEHVDGGTSRFDPQGIVYQAVCAGCGGNSDFPTTAGAVSNTNNSSNCNLGVFKFDFQLAQLIAVGEVSEQEECLDYVFEFQNNSVGAQNFLWDFGDGTTSDLANPSHVYNSPGVYSASLVVSSDEGCVGADTAVFEISVLGLECGSLSAGDDVLVSALDPSTDLMATFEGCGDFVWLGGSGVYGTSNTDPESSYTLSQEEIDEGMAVLVASLSDSSQSCFDTVIISVFQADMDNVVYDFDDCDAGPGETKDYGEFEAEGPDGLGCAEISASNVYRVEPSFYRHSCTPGVNGSPAICVSSMDTCDYIPNSEYALRFDLTLQPQDGQSVGIEGMSFWERAPVQFDWIDGDSGLNNYPTLYGVRVMRDGQEIYREENLMTNFEWTEHSIDWSGLEDFEVSDSAVVYSIELTGYCLVGEDSEITAWDVDEIQVDFACLFPGLKGTSDTEEAFVQKETSQESILDYRDVESPESVVRTDGIHLLASYPNPAESFAYFGFVLEEQKNASFQVIDMTGRILYNQSGRFDAGQHVLRLSEEELGSPSGVVIYRLVGEDFQVYNRMVFK